MNRIYQSIWNHTVGTFVAVSEFAKRGGKKAGGVSCTSATGGGVFALKSLVASMLLAAGFNAWALPTGGAVSVGSATIDASAGALNITQTSQNVAINWQAFNIATGEAVHFLQPGTSSIALNRVLGSDPSSILGNLSANGRVFLVNPNGVLFGPEASVNVGGLVASTLAISDSDFAAGLHHFAGAGEGSVVNQGSIRADGGSVALLGANVSNQGIIQAALGTVALAAGNAITLDVAGDGLLNVAVSEGAVNALVQNGGMIQADGGTVLMTARSASALLQSAVNNTGVIRARSIENRNGTIILTGDSESGTVNIAGTLDVSASAVGQTGGSVIATGNHVGLFDAQIAASGDAGGGTVLIGGGWQGKNPTVENANATYMSADSTINADAISSGDGGTVVLWADGSTRAYGAISARGGDQSGNGGLIETSGHWLDVAGIGINASAPQGASGMWLLDPADVTISSAVTSGASSSGNVFAPNSGVNTANVNVSDLVTALGGANITVTTDNSGASGTGNGDINVNSAVTWTAPTTLSLNADRDVNINAAITGTDGSLMANAGNDIDVNAQVTTTTGSFNLRAVNDVNLSAAATITTGNLTAIAGQNVNVGAAVTVTTGDVILIADNNGTGPGAIVGGTVQITCGSNCITISTGDLTIRFNPASYATTNSEILAYDLNLTGGGELDAKAWVFGLGQDKIYNGLRNAAVIGLEPDLTSTLPPVTLNAVTNALFDTQHVGIEKQITFQTTFANDVFALFAPYGTTPGTYVTRADITRAPLTITANNGAKVYGETFVLSPQAFTPTGLVNGETVASVNLVSSGTVPTAGVAGSPYAITPSNASGGTFSPGNYQITYVDGVLVVTPAPLTITASDATKLFGEMLVLSPAAFTSEGLVNGDTVGSVTLTSAGLVATASADGSPYPITPSNATEGTFTPGNYDIDYVAGALVITPIAVDPDPVDPDPVDPDPVDPDPVDPDPVDPDPVDPDPVDPDPVDPDPVDPDPVDPDPVDPDPVEPDPVDPDPVLPLPLVPVLPGEALRPDTTALDQDGVDFETPPLLKPNDLDLTVVSTGSNVPPGQLTQLTPPQAAPVAQPKPYTPPVYPPKQDRN